MVSAGLETLKHPRLFEFKHLQAVLLLMDGSWHHIPWPVTARTSGTF